MRGRERQKERQRENANKSKLDLKYETFGKYKINCAHKIRQNFWFLFAFSEFFIEFSLNFHLAFIIFVFA